MNGFTFFRNYYEAINDPDNELTEEEQGRLYNAIFAYMFDGTEPDLKGACRMAFNLIKVSLDLSKTRSEAGRKGGEGNQTDSKTEANGKQTSSKTAFACDLPILEERRKKQERNSRDETIAGAPAREEREEEPLQEVAAFKAFMERHPDLVLDLQNPDLIATVDWELMDKKIGESRILKPKKSLSWLVGHYGKIIGDVYKDFGSPAARGEDEVERKKAEWLEKHPWQEEG